MKLSDIIEKSNYLTHHQKILLLADIANKMNITYIEATEAQWDDLIELLDLVLLELTSTRISDLTPLERFAVELILRDWKGDTVGYERFCI